MSDITRSGHDTDAPTGIRKQAFDLSKLYAQEKGFAPRPTPMKVLVDGNITVADLERRLRLAGLEIYPDATGANFIRTIEAGDLHRQLVRAERDVAHLERTENFRRREIVSYSREQPPETRYVPRSDPDADYDDLRDEIERS